MPLVPGDRLGPYEILEAIGKGGMGEVYRARDTRLGREVAIKVSAQPFDERFQREARIISSLNHPNICTLHDVGDTYIVMESIEGPTLADRINEGPLPLDEALSISWQIAEALEAAHEKGVIHRDLKPANVKVTPGGLVKVLDFGLAKAAGPPAAQDDAATVTDAGTEDGVVLGTSHYMSPEQATGKPVDRRSDIYAFGAVLYEMVTGRRLHRGEGLTEILASVIRDQPDWSDVPPQLHHLLRRCLQKDPQKRLRHIGDVSALAEASTKPRVASGRPWMWPLIAAASVLVASVSLMFNADPRTSAGGLVQLLLPVNVEQRGSVPLISPDGRLVAFVGDDSDGQSRLWIRPMASRDPYPLPGTKRAQGFPFWSWDSRQLVYSTGSQIRKVEIGSSSSQPLANVSGQILQSGFWTPDDRIVIGLSSGVVAEIPAQGGTLTVLHHGGFPSLLPDRSRYTYFLNNEIHLARLPDTSAAATHAATEHTNQVGLDDETLFPAGPSSAVYSRGSAGGYLLYLEGVSPIQPGTLVARPFEADTGAVGSQAFPVAENVPMGGFSVSTTGIVIYSSGHLSLGSASPRGVVTGVLTWYDREGNVLTRLGEEESFRPGLRISPQRDRVAASRAGDIWLTDLGTSRSRRLTLTEGTEELGPVWMPDGSELIFTRQTSPTTFDLYRKSADGSGEARLVARLEHSAGILATDISQDGRYLLVGSVLPADIFVLPLRGADTPAELTPLSINPTADELLPRWSPNGRFIAYQSDELGEQQVYVQAFDPESGHVLPDKWMISTEGGGSPQWTRDGTALVYRALDGEIISVEVSTVASFARQSEHALFRPPQGTQWWDMTPDGQRFLIPVPAPEPAPAPYVVLQNWSVLPDQP